MTKQSVQDSLMKLGTKNFLTLTVLLTLLLWSSHNLVHGQDKGNKPSVDELASPAAEPDLADIVPLSSELSGRLVILESSLSRLLDVPLLEQKYAETHTSLVMYSDQIKKFEKTKDYGINSLVRLREVLKQEKETYGKAIAPLNNAVRQLGIWRKEWLNEKKQWNKWQSNLLIGDELVQLNTIFTSTTATIDTALNLVLPQLNEMLALQKKVGNIFSTIDSQVTILDGMIVDTKRGALFGNFPPMFSSQYVAQLNRDLWYELQKGFGEIVWVDKRFLTKQGWIILIQSFLALAVIITAHRNRHLLKDSKRWHFLTLRPYAAGFFLSCMATYLTYAYQGAPAIWVLAITTLAGASFARITGGLLEATWQRQYVYGLVIVFVVNSFLNVISFPLPLLRLYVVVAALSCSLLSLRWAGVSSRQKESLYVSRALRLSSLVFILIIIAGIWGMDGRGIYLFVSLIDSLITAAVFMLFVYMIHGVVEWLFQSSPLRRSSALHTDDLQTIIRRMTRFIDISMAVMILLPGYLMIWGVYDTLKGATQGLMAFRFNIGSQQLSVGLLIAAAGVLYGSFFISWLLQKLLMDEVLMNRRVDRGVRLSMVRLVHYAIIFIGCLIAISTLGFEVTKLTIMLSALGVGIGFGLQSVVNNFVSGLILLFEGPVRVGDVIEINGKWAEIKRIGLRATTVQTLDEADVIIPNADLISHQVTNWTLSSRRVRLIIPVGVAYGSDVELVMATLAHCAKDQENLTPYPPPQVLFLSFGESSLNFELRVWVTDADNRLRVTSNINREIDRTFRENKIEIAFPQRDLHLRSVDETACNLLHKKALQTASTSG